MSEIIVDSIVSTTEGGLVSVAGIASEAIKLQTARTISLIGDVIGSVSFDGTSNVSIAASITAIPFNSVELGTDTTGNYVATIADSGSSDIVVNNSGTETSAVTLGLTTTGVTAGSYGSSSVVPILTVDSRGRLTSVGTTTLQSNSATASALQTARTISLTGDVAGSVSFDGTSNVSIAATIQPNSVTLGTDTDGSYVATIADSGSSDIVVNNSGTETAAVTLGLTTTGVTAGSYGSSSVVPILTVDSRGRLTSVGTTVLQSNSTTASSLQTARTISLTGDVVGSVSFDGSANVSIAATIQPDSVTLGTDTFGSYVASITNGSYITGGNGGSEGAALTLAVDATSANTASKVVARDASGNFSAGTITANLTGTATSTTNIPNLTGDVTSVNTVTTLATVNSNVGTFGSSTAIPSITVNAKGLVTGVTTSSITVGDGTLTLATSGTGLSGSQTFSANQSGNTTFTVTSNATSDSTNGAIVSRNGSGGFSAGIITATQFSTGSGTLGISTNTISGPSIITIDPAAVGDNTGTVVIKGDLQIDGTTTTINSTTVTVDDLNITLASGAANAAAANGAGITVDGASATLTYASSGDKWVFNKELEATDFNSTSDINLKENIEIYGDAVKTIQSLEGVKFTWKESQKSSVGVIAQQVESVVPELVQTGDDHKTVNYNGLIGILIEAVKEQQTQIEDLKNQIEELKK